MITKYDIFLESNNNDLINLLNGPNPVEGLLHLDKLGILDNILPELTALKSNTKGHKDNFLHSLGVLQNCIDLGLGIEYRLSALLHDSGKASTKRYYPDKGWTFHNHEEVGSRFIKTIWDRLKLPQDLYEKVYLITKYHGMVKVLSEEGVSESAIRRFLTEVGDSWDILLKFAKADMTTKYQDRRLKNWKTIDGLREKIEEFLVNEKERSWRMAADGNDIMSILNIKPGRELGQIKSDMEKMVKDGTLENDRETLLDYIKKLK